MSPDQRGDLGSLRRDRIDRMIRGRAVTRMGNQAAKNTKKERTVTWGRRFVHSASSNAEGGGLRSRRREFDNSAVDVCRQVVSFAVSFAVVSFAPSIIAA
jgi:hypothetical protein